MAVRPHPQQSHPFSFRVNLIKKIKLGNSWRFAPVVSESNGKLKDKVLIGENVEVHPEGSYYIEWRENGHRLREKVFKEDAIERARRKALELEAMKQGLIESQTSPAENRTLPAKEDIETRQERKPEAPSNRIAMNKAIDDYFGFHQGPSQEAHFPDVPLHSRNSTPNRLSEEICG